MKRLLTMFVLTVAFYGFANAQVTMSIPDTTLPQNGVAVSLPVNVANFNNIGAISLQISYDPNVLSFTGLTNAPSSGTILSNASNGVIYISWFNTSPLNMNNGTLFNLNFNQTQDSSDLIFITANSEIADTAANILPVTYNNGKINGATVTTLPAKFGGNVWQDINNNGIKDSGEPGLKWVTVSLFTSAGVGVNWTITDSLGNYSFANLNPGSYYAVFYLIDANNVFKFTTKNVSADSAKNSYVNQLSDTTGKTDNITLTSGEVNLSINAGVINKSSGSTGTPSPSITVDDGIILTPDSGATTTYVIKYGNTGNGYLFNAAIVDSLPVGLTFVSSTSGSLTSQGSNVFMLNAGTMEPGDSGSVQVTVRVDSVEFNYFNVAYLKGNDSQLNQYQVSNSDLDIADTTSDGDNSGLESRGDIAVLLLRRRLNIQNGLITKVVSNKGKSTVAAVNDLSTLIPSAGPFNSQPVQATPFDLLSVTNAISCYAVDYDVLTNKGSVRVGGIFSSITPAPYIYDHLKSVCDRLGGYQLDELKLVNVNGYSFYAAKLVHPIMKVTDYAISFSVYETPTGYSIQNKWTYEEYQAPTGTSGIYNFQVWASSYDGAASLVQNIIAKFKALNAVAYLNTTQNTPDVFINSSNYSLDGNIHLTIFNSGTSAKQISLNTDYRISQGDSPVLSANTYSVQPGLNNININTGVISDANLYMSDAQGFRDEVYVSSGAYTYFNGANSTVSTFTTNNFTQPQLSSFSQGSLVLSGGVNTSIQLNDYVSIMRSFNPEGNPYDLSKFNSLSFDASGSGTVAVIFNMANTQNYNYYLYKINLTEQTQRYTINFNQFAQSWGTPTPFDASQIEEVGFVINASDNTGVTNFDFSVKNIAFAGTGLTGINEDKTLPKEFGLAQNYPNPFNPSTVIQFSVPKQQILNLTVYNILGQKIATLINGEVTPGVHNVTFNALNLSSGIYFYRLVGDNVNIVRKMILTK
ncbi:MAG: SdrD B-like domain-containing protein [Ignavibacteriaceae bacterium]